jgi:hypothetical protein
MFFELTSVENGKKQIVNSTHVVKINSIKSNENPSISRSRLSLVTGADLICKETYEDIRKILMTANK